MNNNPLREIFEEKDVRPYRVADRIRMSRSHIYKLLDENGIPPGTNLGTLDRVANELGYSVQIRFVKGPHGDIGRRAEATS